MLIKIKAFRAYNPSMKNINSQPKVKLILPTEFTTQSREKIINESFIQEIMKTIHLSIWPLDKQMTLLNKCELTL